MDSPYTKLAAINVNDRLEKKNGLSYLSWAWAVDQLLRQDANANWEYAEPTVFPDGTMMVRCTVTAFGKAMTAHLPVMDYKNKAIPKPNAFDVNTAMQRCLVKAIALHGLGLYIYAGEDLPETVAGEVTGKGLAKITPTGGSLESLEPDMQDWCRDLAHRVSVLLKKGDTEGAWEELTANDADLDEVTKVAVWSLLDSKERSALKKFSDLRKASERAAA